MFLSCNSWIFAALNLATACSISTLLSKLWALVKLSTLVVSVNRLGRYSPYFSLIMSIAAALSAFDAVSSLATANRASRLDFSLAISGIKLLTASVTLSVPKASSSTTSSSLSAAIVAIAATGPKPPSTALAPAMAPPKLLAPRATEPKFDNVLRFVKSSCLLDLSNCFWLLPS